MTTRGSVHRASTSRVESVEPSSTTISSKSGYVWFRILSIAAGNPSALVQAGRIILTWGPLLSGLMDAYIRWQRGLKKIITRRRTGNNPATSALPWLPRHPEIIRNPVTAASILNTPKSA